MRGPRPSSAGPKPASRRHLKPPTLLWHCKCTSCVRIYSSSSLAHPGPVKASARFFLWYGFTSSIWSTIMHLGYSIGTLTWLGWAEGKRKVIASWANFRMEFRYQVVPARAILAVLFFSYPWPATASKPRWWFGFYLTSCVKLVA